MGFVARVLGQDAGTTIDVCGCDELRWDDGVRLGCYVFGVKVR